jgi:F0F1-type ATP synthase epsilon subunit
MKLTLLKPYDKKEMRISWLEVNSSAGNYVLTSGHAPMILALKENSPITYCLTNGKQETETISGGILRIDRDEATIVLNT